MKKYYLFILLAFFANASFTQDPSWFTEVTAQVGMDSMEAFRINVTDINNDDYPDLVIVETFNQRDQIRIYLNNQDTASADPTDRVFEDITAYSNVNVHPLYPDSSRRADAVCLADINNDGNVDLISGIWHWTLASVIYPDDRCAVMLGDGTGKFEHVVNNGFDDVLGVVSMSGMSYLDYNQDGILDVIVSTFFQDYPADFRNDRLMKGNGDGTFTDATSPFDIGVVKEPNYGISAVDWNNDGWTDIMTSPYCRSQGSLWRNNAGVNFSDMAGSVNYSATYMYGDTGRDLCQWGAFPYDYDNDSDMDVLHVLVHGGLDANEGRTVIANNLGPANDYRLEWDLDRLTRKNPQSTHLGNMDATWFDMNNDMLADLFITETVYQPATDRGFFYLQDDTHYLTDITGDLGLLGLKSPHAVESFDFDLDGDYDLLMNGLQDGNRVRILENEIGDDNNWVGIKLKPQTGINHNCVGSRITVVSGGVSQMREVHAGVGHFAGQQPFILNFGLKNNMLIDSIIVRWPSQDYDETVLVNPNINEILEIQADLPAGIAISGGGENIVVYPNPASDRLRVGGIDLSADNLEIAMFDLLGNELALGVGTIYSNSTLEFSIDDIPAGMYIVKIADPEYDVSISRKIMVRR